MVAPPIRAIGPGWIEDAEGSLFNLSRFGVARHNGVALQLIDVDRIGSAGPKGSIHADQPAELRAAIVDATNWPAGGRG